jgi:hypothetical protein
MTKIEKLTKKRVEVETMLWDGTDEAAAAIVEWMGWIDTADPSPAFLPRSETSGRALIWVAHNMSWSPLPIGYRVARELDGSGFYPLSPEGRRDGYEADDERLMDPSRNEELREGICEWLRANDLDPNRVPSWARPILDTVDPENILITVPYWCRNDDDRPFFDRLTGSLAVQAETTLMKDGQFPAGQVLAWINGGSRPSGETE